MGCKEIACEENAISLVHSPAQILSHAHKHILSYALHAYIHTCILAKACTQALEVFFDIAFQGKNVPYE